MKWRTTGLLFLVLLLLGGVVYWQSRDPGTVPPTADSAPVGPVADTPLFPPLETQDVVRLEIGRETRGVQRVFAQEEAGMWMMTVPTMTQVLSTTVAVPLRSLLEAGSRRTLPVAANPPAVYCLDVPPATIVVAARRGEDLLRYELAIGNLTPAEDAYYVQRGGDPRVHVVPTFAINNMLELLP